MNKMKKLGYGLLAFAPYAVLAQEEGGIMGALSEVTNTIGVLATAISGLLVAALTIYAGFVAYRKVREAMNKA